MRSTGSRGSVLSADSCGTSTHRGAVVDVDEVGSFDWLLRAGQNGAAADGAGSRRSSSPRAVVRPARRLSSTTGGFLEPFFSGGAELDLATRMIARGWDVRYLPTAVFDHRETS